MASVSCCRALQCYVRVGIEIKLEAAKLMNELYVLAVTTRRIIASVLWFVFAHEIF